MMEISNSSFYFFQNLVIDQNNLIRGFLFFLFFLDFKNIDAIKMIYNEKFIFNNITFSNVITNGSFFFHLSNNLYF